MSISASIRLGITGLPRLRVPAALRRMPSSTRYSRITKPFATFVFLRWDRQGNKSPGPPPPASRPPQPPPPPPPASGKKGLFSRSGVRGLIGVASLVLVFLVAQCAPGDSCLWELMSLGPDNEFSAFDVVSREQVSPTAFIVTVRKNGQSRSNLTSKAVQAAWQHGLWSVEIKQPECEIARHYTPLPSLPPTTMKEMGGGEGQEQKQQQKGDDAGELRFLIRKMDGGDVSTYLFKLQPGQQMWLRGPHYGFDVSRRLGHATDLVFLAAGTGIAPALQLAHKVLAGPQKGPASADDDEKPRRIRILWANRKAVDAAGRDRLFRGTSEERVAPESSLGRQIADLQQVHGDSFSVKYFVDEENSFITPNDVIAATGFADSWWDARLSPLSSSSSSSSSSSTAPDSCRWHSPAQLSTSSGQDDTPAASDRNSGCTCPVPAGKKLCCVSGPDGFIDAYAGPRRWLGCKHVQGPVEGVLGAVLMLNEASKRDWLVLKL